MTREQAVKTITKWWGKRAVWRAYDSVSSPERRAKARAEADAHKQRIEAIDADIAERERTSGITALREERRAAREQQQKALGWARYYKFHIGKQDSMFTEIVAEGDTWREALDAAEAKGRNK